MKFSSLLEKQLRLFNPKLAELTNLLESFFIIFLRDKITPYTSFASSSKASALFICGGALLFATDLLASNSSLTATTIPELDISVFLGLLNVEVLVPSEVGG